MIFLISPEIYNEKMKISWYCQEINKKYFDVIDHFQIYLELEKFMIEIHHPDIDYIQDAYDMFLEMHGAL